MGSSRASAAIRSSARYEYGDRNDSHISTWIGPSPATSRSGGRAASGRRASTPVPTGTPVSADSRASRWAIRSRPQNHSPAYDSIAPW
jgi:hypothetical protein